jgi:hypothetical protein
MQQESKLTYIHPLQAATTCALVTLTVSAPAVLLVKFVQLFESQPAAPGELGWYVWVVLPLANSISAFIVGGLVSWAFNVVARFTGGVGYRTQSSGKAG